MEALTKTKAKVNIDTSNISTANGGISSLIGKFSSAKAAVGGLWVAWKPEMAPQAIVRNKQGKSGLRLK